MVIEADMAGNYVGSSYGWQRDWSKFGLLYLHKGNWNGEQILGELGEICASTLTSEGAYGAQFWLNMVSFRCAGICFIVAVFKADGSDHSIIGFGYRTHGLKRRSRFRF
jgi:hypothetical protein